MTLNVVKKEGEKNVSKNRQNESRKKLYEVLAQTKMTVNALKNEGEGKYIEK